MTWSQASRRRLAGVSQGVCLSGETKLDGGLGHAANKWTSEVPRGGGGAEFSTGI